VRVMRVIGDRMLGMLVPKATAQAACSGSYGFCSGVDSACVYMYSDPNKRGYYTCYVHANCTDTCSRTSCC
jgi:hypothetical protein